MTGRILFSFLPDLPVFLQVLGNETLPKVAREQAIRLVEEVRGVINMQENEKNRRNRREMVQSALQAAMARDEEGPVVVSCPLHNVGQVRASRTFFSVSSREGH